MVAIVSPHSASRPRCRSSRRRARRGAAALRRACRRGQRFAGSGRSRRPRGQIVNTDTNFTRETTTDSQGAYSFNNIQAGPYDRQGVAYRGSARPSSPACRSGSGRSAGSISTLQVGAMSETITVQSAAELLQTDKADVHTELKSRRSPICRSIASGTIRGSSSWCRARCRRPFRMPKPTRRSGRST